MFPNVSRKHVVPFGGPTSFQDHSLSLTVIQLAYVPWSKVAILGMVIPPLIGILIMGPYKPLLLGWVSHPLLYGNFMGVDRPDCTSGIYWTCWHKSNPQIQALSKLHPMFSGVRYPKHCSDIACRNKKTLNMFWNIAFDWRSFWVCVCAMVWLQSLIFWGAVFPCIFGAMGPWLVEILPKPSQFLGFFWIPTTSTLHSSP